MTPPYRCRTRDCLRPTYGTVFGLFHAVKVHMTRVLHIARISNVNRVMFVDRNERGREDT